ncbi:MAG TPA: hypothetical protein P5267_03830 [Patescibacteria group bacterium]|nr:hypothetical protein [Patescibacteria group bacterium]
MKKYLGKYSLIKDELVHIFLSLPVIGIGYILNLSLVQLVVCFLAGFFVDADHFFNSFIVKKVVRFREYKGTISRGSHGYTPKIFHGVDAAAAVGFYVHWSEQNWIFATCIFAVLVLHELWDFLVYPHHYSELFLISRAARKFKPGLREKFVGVFFDNETLKY